MSRPLLEVRDLKVHFPVRTGGILFAEYGTLKAVDGITFDLMKFSWLFSTAAEPGVAIAWKPSRPISTAELRTREIIVGGSGDSSIIPQVFNFTAGTKFKIVQGYPGTSDLVLAMERGEVDGICGLSWSTIKTRHAQWLKDKKITIFVQAAFKKEPEMGDVPLIVDLTKDQETAQIMKLFLAAQEMARPFAAPPGIPEDRKAALIAAFEATMKDPEFLSEAQKLSIDVSPVTAAHLNSLLADLYATPKAVLQKAAVAVAK